MEGETRLKGLLLTNVSRAIYKEKNVVEFEAYSTGDFSF